LVSVIGLADLVAMNPGVISAAAARGGSLDQAALTDASRPGQIGGARTDVFDA
jgi:phosphoglycerate dehydrogenase-like enzyme